MAKATPDTPFILHPGSTLQAHLSADKLAPIYLVTSDDPPQERGPAQDPPSADPAALRAVVADIEAAALRGGDPSLDLVRIDYLDGDHIGDGVHALIANEARSMSLFGGRRVVSVAHCEGLDYGEGTRKRTKTAAGDDPLERLIAGLPEGGAAPFILILCASRFDKRKRAYKDLAARGAIVAVRPMDPAQLQTYLVEQAAAFRIAVDRSVAQRIWDRLGGGEPARLRQTADRLLLDVGVNGRLTVEHVEAVVPLDRDAGVWAITDAIAAGDAIRGLSVLHLLIEHGQEPIAICAAIAANLRGSLRVEAALRSGVADQQVGAAIGMHPYRAGEIVKQLRRMRPGQLERALQTVAELDVMLRATALGERKTATTRWLEMAIVALCNGTPLRIAGTPSVQRSL